MKIKKILALSLIGLCSYTTIQPLFKMNALEQSIKERAYYASLLQYGPQDNSTIKQTEEKKIENLIINMCKKHKKNNKKLKNIIFKSLDFEHQTDAKKIAIIKACVLVKILKVFPVK